MKNVLFSDWLITLLWFIKFYGEKLFHLLSIGFWLWHDLHDLFRNKGSILAKVVVAKD